MLKFDNIPFDDQATYNFLGMGLTKGVFQLEEYLGERYSQVVKPKCILDIADIISIIRPGCKEAFHVDGQTTMLDAYCKIRNNEMQPQYLHDDLKVVLEKTHSVLIYQEQITEICIHMAGMTLKEADMVRYAMGKKRAELMQPWYKPFIDGCMKKGYSQDLAEKIWDWIDKSSGYLFNKSHAVAYAVTAYKTAYAKCHYPTQFYTSMMTYASNKDDTFEEMLQLVNDAKLFAIAVIPPTIKRCNQDFEILNKNTISYGIQYIKGIGKNAIKKINRLQGTATWDNFLVYSDRFGIDKTSCEALIKTGTLDEYKIPRTQMLAEYEILRGLTEIERCIVLSLMSGILHPTLIIDIDNSDCNEKRVINKYIKLAKTGIFDICGIYGSLKNHIQTKQKPALNLEQAIRQLIESCVPNKTRCDKLNQILNDYLNKKPYKISKGVYQLWEKYYFGIPLSTNDKGVIFDAETIPCIQVINVMDDADIKIGGVIERVSYTTAKRGKSAGKKMAFVDIADNSFMLQGVVAFPENFEKYEEFLQPGMAIFIKGRKLKNSNSLVINYVERM